MGSLPHAHCNATRPVRLRRRFTRLRLSRSFVGVVSSVCVPDIARRGPIDRTRRRRQVLIVRLTDPEHAFGHADHTADDAIDHAAHHAADHGSYGRSGRSGNTAADRDALLRAAGDSLRLGAQWQSQRAGEDAGR